MDGQNVAPAGISYAAVAGRGAQLVDIALLVAVELEMLDAAGSVLDVAGKEGMVEMKEDGKLLEEDSLLLRHEDHGALQPLRVHLPHAPDTLGKRWYIRHMSAPVPCSPHCSAGIAIILVTISQNLRKTSGRGETKLHRYSGDGKRKYGRTGGFLLLVRHNQS